MEKKHFNARYDDATWRALFGRWHAGERSDALRAGAGVSADTWQANARRLGMRIKDLPADDPRRRRVPGFDARAGDYRHPNSALDERDWLRVMALRAGGVRGALLAEVFGVEHATICSQARARGLEAAHLARAAARMRPRPEMAFEFDPKDPAKTWGSLLTIMMQALEEGRTRDWDTLWGCWVQMERMYRREGLL